MPLASANELMERLRAGERLIADGGMGTELIRYGVAPEDVLQANLGLPDAIRSIHDRYLAAGADILTTNTFGLRTGGNWASNLRAGLNIGIHALRESEQRGNLWLSLVPSVVPPERETLHFVATHAPHWSGIVLIETCTSLQEALAATRALRDLPHLELLAVTCHFHADGRMPDATLPETAARELANAGACIVGANCGERPEAFVEIASRMRAVTDAPLLFQPSAGLPSQDGDGHWVYPITELEFAEVGGQLFSAGANIVGGCCGTTPAHIAALRAAMS